jgi:hypothetical protein
MNLRRVMRFSIGTLFLLITLLCLALGWHSARTRDRERLMCDQLVDNLLLSRHWQMWETNPAQKSLVTSMTVEFRTQARFESAFLRPHAKDKQDNAADSYEQQLLARWSNSSLSGAELKLETAQRESFLGGQFTYYKAIRAGQSCSVCHTDDSGKSVKTGDLLAIGKIMLAK